MIRPDIAGQRDYLITLAERGYAVIGDVLDPATVLDPIDVTTAWIPLVDVTEPDRVRLSLDLRYQGVPVPTGRPVFPSLLLRGKRGGVQVAGWESWRAAWLAARDRLAGQELGKLNRWDPGAAMCA